MSKWPNDDRMRGISEFSFFAHFQNHPHLTLIPSFLIILECQGMKMKKGGMSFIRHPIHFHSIPIRFVIQECLGMTEWGWNEGDFWAKAKPLILKSPSFFNHSVIPCLYPFLHMIIRFIWRSFHILISFHPHSYPFLSFLYHSMAERGRNNHSFVIPSFWCHSIIQNIQIKGVCR